MEWGKYIDSGIIKWLKLLLRPIFQNSNPNTQSRIQRTLWIKLNITKVTKGHTMISFHVARLFTNVHLVQTIDSLKVYDEKKIEI